MEITGLPTPVFCGVDWAEDHHDIALVDAGGKQLAKVQIGDDAAGFSQLMALLADHVSAYGLFWLWQDFRSRRSSR